MHDDRSRHYGTSEMSEMSETTDPYTRAAAAARYIRSQTQLQPTLGIILGSGLGAFASHIEDSTSIPYAEIPNFPQSTVEGHSGRLVLGSLGSTPAKVPVAVMQGRVHAYEGYPLADVILPTRVLGLLGCTTLIVTNAAGAINPAYQQGSLVAISDHINLTGTNAALGPNEPRFAVTPSAGQRFFDMSHAYSPRLRALAIEEAARQGFLLDQGVYLAVLGPSFETPAEIRAFRTLGADLVGMSTVHEVIVARHMGLGVLGLSLVTNMAAGVVHQQSTALSQQSASLDQPSTAMPEAIRHAEVMEVGRRTEQQFISLLTAIIPPIAASKE